MHFIGIGGTGLSAIARVLLESGYTVSGSDRNLSPLAKSLQEAGVRVNVGHRPENIEGADVVVRSSAIPDDNIEVSAARQLGIPVLKRSEFLSTLMSGRMGIAVAGTHGKTTTTAMIAWMLTSLGQDPTYIVGGVLKNLGSNAHAGTGQAFVIEADEYDYMFLGLKPHIAVITNIEHDHPDCFPTPEDYFRAFDDFAAQLGEDGTLLLCTNDGGAARLCQVAKARGQKVLTYAVRYSNNGCSNQPNYYTAETFTPNLNGGLSFEAVCTTPGSQREVHALVNLRVPGRHNVQNALAALAVAHLLDLPIDQASQALSEYRGTGRRFEVRAEVNGIIVIDDYAHHPTEIRATLSAARMRFPRSRLWVVWQPHTYSRTRLLLHDFIAAFEQADHILVTEIYAAREQPPQDGFSSQQIVAAITYPNAICIPDFSQAVKFLLDRLIPGDVLLVLSAGDADQISARVVEQLNERRKAGD
ncbi:MAG: UDP-N-acetylmuramate--L-alanine ligase [Acidobacteriaceae bacterium]